MTLALHGGRPIRDRPMPPRPQYGIAERNAANEVVASGNLSGFLAPPEDEFYGGPRVRSLEAAVCEKFDVAYAVAMNSATSCLFAAMHAVGIGPRDNVIVTPWSMSASVSCALAAGATPIFGDIEGQTYGLSYEAIEDHIRRCAHAVVLVDLFGCPPCDLKAIRRVCEQNGTLIVEDAAQAIGASWNGLNTGTLGDVGVYSFNRHKTLQCGEGGVAVTDNKLFAERLQAVRNHGETLPGSRLIGQNYRMGEVEAAIAEVQLGRLEELTIPRVRNAERITEALLELDGLIPPKVPPDSEHVYYLYAIGVPGSAELWAQALWAEGIYNASQYVRPLFDIPLFRGHARIDDSNDWLGWYPEVSKAYASTIVLPDIHAGMGDTDTDDIIAAFQKIWQHRREL